MQISNGVDIIDYPCEQWIDHDGNTYIFPQLPFLVKRGYSLVIPEPLHIPSFVTRRKGRKILAQYGLLPTVEAVVATLDVQGQIDYQDASTFDRTNPVLVYVTGQAGMTEEQVDAMFVEASTL